MNTKVWTIVGVAVAVIALFMFMRSRGPSVQQIGGGDTTKQEQIALSGLGPLAALAEAEFNSQNQLAIQASQERVQGAAINASVETARINAGAQVAAADRQAAAQSSSNALGVVGDIAGAIIGLFA